MLSNSHVFVMFLCCCCCFFFLKKATIHSAAFEINRDGNLCHNNFHIPLYVRQETNLFSVVGVYIEADVKKDVRINT